MAAIQRAALQTDDRQKQLALKYAQDNALYSLEREPRTTPMYARIASGLSGIEFELGNVEQAIAYAEDAIAAQPGLDEGYLALARVLFRHGDISKARDVLSSASTQLEKPSAELSYNLALLELELGDVERAVGQARIAYELGYPLPGLRRRLERIGAWSE